MTVDELASRLDEDEFWEWIEFFKMQSEEIERGRKSSSPEGGKAW